MAPATRTVEPNDERLGIAATVTAGFGAAAVLARDVGGLHLVCPFRYLTGAPCPGCGMTSVASALAHGDVAGAVTDDPAGVVLVAALGALVVLHVSAWLSRRIASSTTLAPGARAGTAHRVLLGVAGVALLAHWATTAITGGALAT